jgi:hypothetical protein
MVMDVGLDYLALHPTLSADQHSILGEIAKFKEWEREVDQEVTGELNNLADWEAGLDD